jgi:hypothetical protein
VHHVQNQEPKDEVYKEGFQYLEEEEELPHDSIKENNMLMI